MCPEGGSCHGGGFCDTSRDARLLVVNNSWPGAITLVKNVVVSFGGRMIRNMKESILYMIVFSYAVGCSHNFKPRKFIGLTVHSTYSDFQAEGLLVISQAVATKADADQWGHILSPVQAYFHNTGMHGCPRPCLPQEAGRTKSLAATSTRTG